LTDLRQGGLDVPCKYTFIGENPHLSNVAILVKCFSMPKKRKIDVEPSSKEEEMHPSKKLIAKEVICVEEVKTNCGDYQMEVNNDEGNELQPNNHWVTFNLSIMDKEIIVKGLL